MTARHDDDPAAQTPAETGRSNNRYILLAVLAVAVVAVIYLLKTNMEPPKPTSTGGGSAAADEDLASGNQPLDDSTMQNLMQQVAHIRSILARDSSNFDAWVGLGNVFFDAQMPTDAITHYRKALELHPNDLNVMTDLATMEREVGRPADAVEILKRALALDSTKVQAWFNLGVIYSFDLKNQKDAIAAWKRFVALSPPSEHTKAVQKEIERLEKDSGP